MPGAAADESDREDKCAFPADFARSAFGVRRLGAAFTSDHCQEITSSAAVPAFLSAAGPGTLPD